MPTKLKGVIMTVFDFEEHQEKRQQSTKITAARLAEVENIQKAMGEIIRLLDRVAQEEANGWVPGTPQTKRTHRVEPIEKLMTELGAGIDLLEGLYS
jgi:hypothetical protein